MMTAGIRWALTLLALAWGASAAAAADEPARQQYDALFGAEDKKVSASYAKRDDAEFAAKLLDAAKAARDSPSLQQLLYDKSYEFAIRWQDGCPIAIEAMELLAAAAPQRAAECDEKLLKACELRYGAARGDERLNAGRALLGRLLATAEARDAAGDPAQALLLYRRAQGLARQTRYPYAEEIGQKIQVAAARQQAAAEIAATEKAHQALPDNQAIAGKLLMLYLVEQDDPNRARALADAAGADEALRTYLPLAGKVWAELDERVCLELGGWYQSLAGKARAAGRPRMLARALAYYQSYLALHGKEDAAALRAKLARNKVQAELAKLPPAECAFVPAPQGVSREILDWTKRRDAQPPEGQVQAVKEMLEKVNGGKEIVIRHRIDDNRLALLDMGDNVHLTSIAPLYGMKLRELALFNTGVTSLEPLRGMPLEHLNCNGCASLTSLAGLEGAPLTSLAICVTAVSSFEPLRGTKLTDLQAYACKGIRSLRGLEGLPLRRLHLHDCFALVDIEPLRGMKLQWLNLTSCRSITDFSPLQDMPLTELILAGTTISQLSVLKGMKLTTLNLDQCRSLVGLDGIEDMPLVHLMVGGTKFATPQAAELLKKRIPTLKEVVIE